MQQFQRNLTNLLYTMLGVDFLSRWVGPSVVTYCCARCCILNLLFEVTNYLKHEVGWRGQHTKTGAFSCYVFTKVFVAVTILMAWRGLGGADVSEPLDRDLHAGSLVSSAPLSCSGPFRQSRGVLRCGQITEIAVLMSSPEPVGMLPALHVHLRNPPQCSYSCHSCFATIA